MNSVKNLLTCQFCKQTFSSTPVVLNCCDVTICSVHLESSSTSNPDIKKRKYYKCNFCEFSHEPSNKHFSTNKIAESLLNFDKTHKKVKLQCSFLRSSLKKCQDLLSEPNKFIYDHVAFLKSEVQTRREEIKIEIDKTSDEMLKELEAYERECYDSLKMSELKEAIALLESENRDAQDTLDKWMNELKLVEFDEVKWEEVHTRAFFLKNHFNARLNELKDELLINKFWTFEKKNVFREEFKKELWFSQR